MSTVTAFIRTLKTDKNKSVNVRFRLRDGRTGIDKKTGKEYYGIQLFHKSELSVNPDKWDETQQKIKARCIIDEQERKAFDTAVNDRKALIKSIYLEKGKALTSDLLDVEIDRALYPEKYEASAQTFFEAFEEFLVKHPLSEVRRKNFRVVYRCLKRFELYTRKTDRKRKNWLLELDNVNVDTLQLFSDFLKKEHEYYKKHKEYKKYLEHNSANNITEKEVEYYKTLHELYTEFPEYHEQKPRGQNTINGIFTKLRTFFLWCVKNQKTSNRPFDNFKIDECVYGTPFYITIDERNQLYKLNLSHRPELERQRDIFIFQCLIGCRIADFYKLTKQNIINEAIEYIAGKTKDSKPTTVRVPLNSIAKEILAKYTDFEGETLFPFISQQKYNDAIKKAFELARITRSVVICDPLTRENIIRPINEVASSHLARRCFVGNMYKKAKDQNLVAELSGHKQNSKAFARYREIDEDLRKELVSMIE